MVHLYVELSLYHLGKGRSGPQLSQPFPLFPVSFLSSLKIIQGALYGFSVKHIKTKKGRVGKDRLMQGGAPGSYPDCSFARLTVLPRVWTVTGAPYLKGSPHTSLNLGRSPSPPLPFPILTHPPKEVSYGVPLPRRRYR